MSSNTIVSGPSRSFGGRQPAGEGQHAHARGARRLDAGAAVLDHHAAAPASAPICSAACRKRSGAGLPRATSSALKIRPANRSYRPVNPSV